MQAREQGRKVKESAYATCAGFSKLIVGLQAVESALALEALYDLVDDVAKDYEAKKSCKTETHKLTSGVPTTTTCQLQSTTKQFEKTVQRRAHSRAKFMGDAGASILSQNLIDCRGGRRAGRAIAPTNAARIDSLYLDCREVACG
jgi:hypothetical protein